MFIKTATLIQCYLKRLYWIKDGFAKVKNSFNFIQLRTLGCYPLTGAVLSEAETIDDVINELKQTAYTERITRVIDYDTDFSMEKKKINGYF